MDEPYDEKASAGSTAMEDAAKSQSEPMQEGAPAPQPPAAGSNRGDTITNLPAINNWVSATLFSALGALVSVMWRNVFYRILPPDLRYIPVAAVAVLYVYLFYNSYYTESPRVRSSRAISFLNFACTGVVFGYFLNKSLKKSKSEGRPVKGMAPTVATFFWIAMVVVTFGYYNFTTSGQLAKNYVYDATTDAYRPKTVDSTSSDAEAQPDNKSSEPQQVTIPLTDTTVTIPAGWSYEDKVYEEQGISGFEMYPPSSNKKTAVVIMAQDVSEYITEDVLEECGGEFTTRNLTEDSVLAQNRGMLSTIDSESAELVTINGIEYWKAEAEGARAKTGTHAKCISYYHHEGMTLYSFSMTSIVESEQTNDALIADVEAIAASAIYK